MASQTVTSDTNLTLVTAGMNNGQNITINSGAVVTATTSPDKLIGQVTINDGELFIDGANALLPIVFVGEQAEEINVNGAGIFRTSLGWWEFPTTSSGGTNQTFDCSTYYTSAIIDADVFSGVWVETGRRLNYDSGNGVTPNVGDWVFKTSDNDVHGRITEVVGDSTSGYIVVRFLTGVLLNNDSIELHTLQDNSGPDYQKSWFGSMVGSDVLEPDVYQEFGNARQNAINGVGNLGSGISGFGFDQTHGSNTLTFGDGVNGFIPPNGAKIRVPMVHFATSTTTAVGTNDAVWVAGGTNKYELETVNGGECYFDGVSMGSAYFEDNLGGAFIASYCAANLNFGIYAALTRTTYDHCIFVGEIEGDTRSAARSVPPIVDLVSGADVRDCLQITLNDSAETTQFGGQTSIGVNIERCIQISNAASMEAEILRIDEFTVYDLVVIGTQLTLTTSKNGDIKLLKTQRNLNGSVSGNDQLYLSSSCDNIKITGWEVLQNSVPDDSKVAIVDSSNIEIRGFHFIEDKFDNEALGGTQGEEFVSIGGLCSNIKISRCWMNRGSPNEFAFIASGTSKDITIQNCSGEYSGEIETDGFNTLFRGVHGGSGVLGGSSGVETDLFGTAGSNTGDVFESNTSGYFKCNMCPASAENPIEIVSGNPKFTKDGDVDVIAGDQFIIEMPYFALGHTGFKSNAPTFARNAANPADSVDNWGTGFVDVEFQYDTGNGYNGIWLDLRNASNRTSITNMVDGIKLKYRITGLASRTNLQAFVVYTTTTIQAQIDNYYPIDQFVVDFKLTGLVIGTEVRIYRTSDSGFITGVENILSDTFTYEYNYITDENVYIQILSEPYENITLRNIDLTNQNQTIPIQQRFDRNFLNP